MYLSLNMKSYCISEIQYLEHLNKKKTGYFSSPSYYVLNKLLLDGMGRCSIHGTHVAYRIKITCMYYICMYLPPY